MLLLSLHVRGRMEKMPRRRSWYANIHVSASCPLLTDEYTNVDPAVEGILRMLSIEIGTFYKSSVSYIFIPKITLVHPEKPFSSFRTATNSLMRTIRSVCSPVFFFIFFAPKVESCFLQQSAVICISHEHTAAPKTVLSLKYGEAFRTCEYTSPLTSSICGATPNPDVSHAAGITVQADLNFPGLNCTGNTGYV